MSWPLYADVFRSLRGKAAAVTNVEVAIKDASTPLYASVALDVKARELKERLFTYVVPPHFREDAFIGAQVLVPFGQQGLVAGYVVSLSDSLDSTQASNIRLKEVADVLAPEPLFDARYISLLSWVADYYCASISDVIAASIPSIIAPKIKRVVRLNRSFSARSLDRFEAAPANEPANIIIELLEGAKASTLLLSALKLRFQKETGLSQSVFFRALSYLRQDGIVLIEQETSTPKGPKVKKIAILTGQEPRSKRHLEIVQTLGRHGGQMAIKDLIEASHTTLATIHKLAKEGVLSLGYEELIRDPLAGLDDSTVEERKENVTLTDDQQKAFSRLSSALKEKMSAEGEDDSAPWLLYGVTGSGKTEIYFRLIENALQSKRTALLLVPEISLTPQLARLLKKRFGSDVSVWHSALSPGERFDTWRRLRSGDVKVLLGARSASLVYMPDLALIIMDEEHDGSYKQTSPSPRYHAREVAEERARREGALLVLGSATPDVATFHKAETKDRILTLPERVFKQALPAVSLIDMRQEFQDGNRGVISHALDSAIRECLARCEQAIMLINRRGYANHVFCRACGYVVKCKNCSVSLVFHQGRDASNSFLSCHHCGFNCPAFTLCPNCKSPFIKQYGLGTQKVEEEINELYPESRTIRLDSDVAQGKGAHDRVLTDFARGNADILIGTQMVAKGLDIRNVTLVGVLAADAAFNVPDYRAVERGFQLLTQVSGRAGRGDRPGLVIFQTYNNEMPAINWAKNHDYKRFMDAELESRKLFEYPPFSQLIRVVVAGDDPSVTEFECEKLAEELGRFLEDEVPLSDVKVLGPAPCLIERLRGKYRFHLLIKNMLGERGRSFIVPFLKRKRVPPGLTMAVDVNALDLM